MQKSILRKKMNSVILTPWDPALKVPFQPRPMKMTVCQCRKGSGFPNGLWRQVRNHEIFLSSGNYCFSSSEEFSSKKKTNKKMKLAKQCGHQASKIKTESFEIFLKWNHWSPIFRHALNFTGRGQSGKFRAWFYGKQHRKSLFLV